MLRLLGVLFLLCLNPCAVRSQQKPKLVYVFDALCGWCYGFSPVMERCAREYEGKVEIEVISGGLRYDENVGPLRDIAPFIKSAYKTVEKTTGVKFGDAFVKVTLEEGSIRLNSLPPAIALCIVKMRSPEKALAFAARLHRMLYVDGFGPEEISRYAGYVHEAGVDSSGFTAAMQDPHYEQMARGEFKRAAAIGATGFPAVFRFYNGTYTRLTSGYVSWDELKQAVDLQLR